MVFKPHLYTIDDAGVRRALTPRSILAPQIEIIPRSQCSFRHQSLKKQSQSALKAVRFKALKEASSPAAIIRLVRDKSRKGVGIWSYDPSGQAGRRVMPETLAYIPYKNG
ncbi:MAG TPA: hypothetical protein ENJ42_01490, partial [Hellea balneolensis]|nr:hypothetical protein [Hellea balneolensis]